MNIQAARAHSWIPVWAVSNNDNNWKKKYLEVSVYRKDSYQEVTWARELMSSSAASVGLAFAAAPKFCAASSLSG